MAERWRHVAALAQSFTKIIWHTTAVVTPMNHGQVLKKRHFIISPLLRYYAGFMFLWSAPKTGEKFQAQPRLLSIPKLRAAAHIKALPENF